MIKIIAFDLDGTLIDTMDWHRQALNEALKEVAGPFETDASYDAVPTRTKLARLTEEKGLPPELHDEICRVKQIKTLRLLDQLKPAPNVLDALNYLSREYKLACVSNAVLDTVVKSLEVTGYLKYFDLLISNEQVVRPKPHPEGYLKCLEHFRVSGKECLVVEDSDKGFEAGRAAGCPVLKIFGPGHLTARQVDSTINYLYLMEENDSNHTYGR